MGKDRQRFLKMKLAVACVTVCFVLSLACAEPSDSLPNTPNRKSTRLNSIQDKLSYNPQSGQVDFPDELEVHFSIEGEDTIRSRPKKVSKVRPIPTFDNEGQERQQSKKDAQYYVGENGSYQVSAKSQSDGSVDSDLKALYKNNKGEKCFFARGESSCWKVDGEENYGPKSWDGGMKQMPGSNETVSRRKRELVYTDFNPNRVLKVVYVVDRPFIDWFRRLNAGDDSAAISDAKDYIYMLNNEVNYMYRGIKETSENCAQIQPMDITVYAQGFYELGTEWRWLRPYINGGGIDAFDTVDTGALPAFGKWVEQGFVDSSGPFDTATFITTRKLYDEGNPLIGTSYLGSVCEPEAGGYRVSMSWDGEYDVALTVARELAHSLGSQYDGVGGCPNYKYMMALDNFDLTYKVKDTWNRWSTCSTAEILNHVRQFPGCLLDDAPTNGEFYDQLCRGTRGSSSKFDIDYQCKKAFKQPRSVACSPAGIEVDGKVPADACWNDYRVSCTNAADVCSFRIITVFDGTPCIGSEPSRDYVCYRGDCIEKVDVCAGRTTAAAPSPTTTAPSSTTTTPSPTTTAPSSTTTTPSPTTTTTTPSPTTTAPSSTTTTPSSTTTAPSSCSCTRLWGRPRTACCRTIQNANDSCCSGCKPNGPGRKCRSDWAVRQTK